MNAKQLIAAVAVFAAAGSAFADVTGTFDDFTNVPSTKTRTEVVAGIQQAKVANTEWVDSSTLVANSGLTRAAVRADAIQSAKTHKVNAEYEFGG